MFAAPNPGAVHVMHTADVRMGLESCLPSRPFPCVAHHCLWKNQYFGCTAVGKQGIGRLVMQPQIRFSTQRQPDRISPVYINVRRITGALDVALSVKLQIFYSLLYS